MNNIKELKLISKKEIWKDIVNYEGIYQISNFGNVRRWRIKRKCWYYLKSSINGNVPYLAIDLSKNGKRKRFLIHRLVAYSFCKRKGDCTYIDHINNNTLDNRSLNLRWITQSENIKKSYDQNRKRKNRGELNGMNKFTKEEVLKIRDLNRLGVSKKIIVSKFNISYQHLRDILSGKRWGHIKI